MGDIGAPLATRLLVFFQCGREVVEVFGQLAQFVAPASVNPQIDYSALRRRFKGGWTTRHYGRPAEGFHAIQMELGCRGYMDEPAEPVEGSWPTPYSDARAASLRRVLVTVIEQALAWAHGGRVPAPPTGVS